MKIPKGTHGLMYIAIMIFVLEGIALYKGINGIAMSATVGALCAVAGYITKSLRGGK